MWLYYKMSYFTGIFKDFTYFLEILIIKNSGFYGKKNF